MMRAFRLTVTLGLLITAAACGTPNNSTGGAGGSPGQVSSTAMPRPTGPPTQSNHAQPDSRAVDLRPIRWNSAQAGRGTQLVVHYTVAGRAECNMLGRVDIVETNDTVTVTVLVGRFPNTNCDGPQPLLAAPFVTVATLREPLGTRHVRDGAS